MKRNTKISCDVSREADNMLKAYCLKHERSKGFLLEKMIRKFCGGETEQEQYVTKVSVTKPKAPKAKRKQVSYPDNLDDQFLLLWETKGKKGQKQKAYDIYRKMSADVNKETCQAFTEILMKDIITNKHEPGYPERHLTSYLNGKFWEE